MENLEAEVDRLFAESDARVFAILHKIAELAMKEEAPSQSAPSISAYQSDWHLPRRPLP